MAICGEKQKAKTKKHRRRPTRTRHNARCGAISTSSYPNWSTLFFPQNSRNLTGFVGQFEFKNGFLKLEVLKNHMSNNAISKF
jgi:hypothetical protein